MNKYIASLVTVLALFSMMLPFTLPTALQAQTTSGLCYVFVHNMGENLSLSSQDGAALTEALSDAGLWSTSTPITSYTNAVALAVSGFQEKYSAQILTPNGLTYGTGFVGTATRNELNSIYGTCDSPINPNPAPAPAPVCPSGWICLPSVSTSTSIMATSTVSLTNSTQQTVSPVNTVTVNSISPTIAFASLSLDPSSPSSTSIGVTNTAQGKYLGLPVMSFDITAHEDNLHILQIIANVPNTGGGSVTAAYLYEGSTEISSTTFGGSQVTFNNILSGTPGTSLPINDTGVFTVKVDLAGLTPGINPAIITPSVSGLEVTMINSANGKILVRGSALGNAQTILGAGPIYSLSGTPTITKTPVSAGSTTFQYSATFNVSVTATGESVNFGLPNAAIPPPAFSVIQQQLSIYKNGTAYDAEYFNPSISYSAPSAVTAKGAMFTVAQNQTVVIPVTVSFTIPNPGYDRYAVQMQGINSSTGLNTFMAGQASWRTSPI